MLNQSGIYAIYNRENGKRYIGSAVRFSRRFTRHWQDLNSGDHHCPHLQHAWNKYGAGAFTFVPLLVCDLADLKVHEQLAIDGLCPEYNASPSAGSRLGMKSRLETRMKIAIKATGRKHSAESRLKIGAAGRGRPCSPETRVKRSIALRGKKRTLETRARIRIARLGKSVGVGHIVSAKTRAKISATLLGHTHSAETKVKIGAAGRGRIRSEAEKQKISVSMQRLRQKQRDARNLNKGEAPWPT